MAPKNYIILYDQLSYTADIIEQLRISLEDELMHFVKNTERASNEFEIAIAVKDLLDIMGKIKSDIEEILSTLPISQATTQKAKTIVDFTLSIKDKNNLIDKQLLLIEDLETIYGWQLQRKDFFPFLYKLCG